VSKKWYIVNAHSGFEAQAKLSLQERIKRHGLESSFGEILIPSENVVQLVKGKKQTRSKKFFPGYMFVEMDMSEQTWLLVKETAKITGFVGNKTSPQAVSPEEVARVTKQVEQGTEKPKAKVDFSEGEAVRVVDGPFSNFNGTVEEINFEKEKVKVLVSIFGRPTPVELDFVQVVRSE
jgi:transcriptional antiterminator NusG